MKSGLGHKSWIPIFFFKQFDEIWLEEINMDKSFYYEETLELVETFARTLLVLFSCISVGHKSALMRTCIIPSRVNLKHIQKHEL